MKKQDQIKTALLASIIGIILFVFGMITRDYNSAKNYYQVYLNGDKIGLIADKDALYNLINEEQKDIKDTYNVETVYPPNGFNIEECTTYDKQIVDVKSVYNKIKEADDFTIEGYTIKIKSPKEDSEDLTIYVLNEDVFKQAITNVITAFVDEEDFEDYINNDQEEIEDVGQIIEKMYFEETITLKLSHISVHEKIYTDPMELSQYLLFGSNKEQNSYTVKAGDTIASISEDNKLNPQEFLIANPKFKDESSILAIGDKVNITLINPILTLIEDIHEVKDEEQSYDKETVYDKNKPTSFKEVTQKGITGIERITQKIQVVNGEQNQGGDLPISTVTIREVQNEITTKGGTKPTSYSYNPNAITGSYVDTGLDWGWPTNRPYTITSQFAWRWGSFHNAIDISGTGFGSPIYAARDGVVVNTNTTCNDNGYLGSNCGGSYGNFILIQHDNGIYTLYGHLRRNVAVYIGQQVSRGQVIGYMGNSGSSTGTHLHFGVSIGMPNQGGSWISPWRLYN